MGYEEWRSQSTRLLTAFSASETGPDGNPLRDGGLEEANARLGKARILEHDQTWYVR